VAAPRGVPQPSNLGQAVQGRRRAFHPTAIRAHCALVDCRTPVEQAGPFTVAINHHTALVQGLQEEEGIAPLCSLQVRNIDLVPDSPLETGRQSKTVQRLFFSEIHKEIHVGRDVVVTTCHRPEEDRQADPRLRTESASQLAEQPPMIAKVFGLAVDQA